MSVLAYLRILLIICSKYKQNKYELKLYFYSFVNSEKGAIDCVINEMVNIRFHQIHNIILITVKHYENYPIKVLLRLVLDFQRYIYKPKRLELYNIVFKHFITII